MNKKWFDKKIDCKEIENNRIYQQKPIFVMKIGEKPVSCNKIINTKFGLFYIVKYCLTINLYHQ